MTPLRILFVAPYVPSPIRVRPFQVIRYLARLGHRITLVALDDGLPHQGAVEDLREVCEAVHIVPHKRMAAALSCAAALPTTKPLWAAYCHSPRMETLLRDLSANGKFDIAHVEHLRAAHFAPCLENLPRIIDAVDCITELRRQTIPFSQGAAKLLSWEEWVKLKTYEPRVYRAFSRIVVTSRHDQAALAALDPLHLPPIEVIANGVDTEYFHPDAVPTLRKDAVPAEESSKKLHYEKSDLQDDCLVFSGKLSYSANEDAARFLLTEILPRLRGIVPGARLILAGSGPSTKLKTLASQTGNVSVTGYVDDLRPFIAQATVAVCPIRIGVGIQNKVLEAMAMGRPVVASSLAARALGGEPDTNGALTVADSPDAIAEACARLLSNPHHAKQAGDVARQIVKTRFRWETSAQRFTELYQRVRSESAGS